MSREQKTKKEYEMKQKSLRQLAKELGVSHSYLSQIRNDKRPPSSKLVSMVSNFEANHTTSNPSGGIASIYCSSI